jgi:hypothetical protein
MVLPTAGELITGIKEGNRGLIEAEYPFAYAHRFIMAYPETIPYEVNSKTAGKTQLSTPARTASFTLQQWADLAGEEKYTLATVLADAYISLHHPANVN